MRYSTLEKLVNTQFNLIAVETQQASTILDTFREYSNLKGEAVYVWKKNIGLYRQDLSHVKIPQTATVQQALNYIQKHQQDSIFIFTDFAEQLDNILVNNALFNFSKTQTKKLFLLDEQLDLPEKFKHFAIETKKLLQMKLLRAA
jgi:hypothetical protein